MHELKQESIAEKIDYLHTEAVTKHKEGNLEEAISFYLESIKLDKNQPAWIYGNVITLLAEVERFDEGLKLGEEAAKIHPESDEVYRAIGIVYQKQNNLNQALTYFQKAIELNQYQPEWLYTQISEYKSQLRLTQAESVDCNSDNSSLKLNISSAKSEIEYQDNAKKINYLHSKAVAKHKEGKLQEAISFYLESIELDENQPAWIYGNVITLLAEVERFDESLKLGEEAAKIHPESDEVYRAIAIVMNQKGDLIGCINNNQKAIQCNPQQPSWVYCKVTESLIRQNNIDRAIEIAQQGIELNPDSFWLHYHLGEALTTKERWDEVVKNYLHAQELQPDFPILEQRLNYALEQKVKLDRQKTLESCLQNIERDTEDIEREQSPVHLIAFFLPQYHPIPENDEWWGKGFTEWTNVTKAKPLFEGHYQPRLPADLGFYDLRLPEVREEQAQLARQYGIHGFCYYYYWFAGKRLLDRPLDEMLETKKPDFPFCLCWANENWSRRWDGSESDILIAQEHSEDNNQAFAESLIPYFLDKRYIRINGKPLLIIYRANILPDVQKTVQQWREVFRKNGIGEVYLCAALTFGLEDAISLGFDAEVEFPPHRNFSSEIPSEELGINNFSGKIYDYRQWVSQALTASMPPEKTRFLTCMLSWDNTARKGKNAQIHHYFSLELYQSWLQANIEKTKISYRGDERLTFINAWNEWAEGTHLEPDQKYGHAYLATTRNALVADCSWQMAVQLLFSYRGQNSLKLAQLLLDLYTKIVQKNPRFQELAEELEKTRVFRIEHITYKNNASETFWYLESCQEGQYLSKNINIHGWVIDKNLRPITIEIIHDDTIIKQIPIKNYREDIFEAYPEFKKFNNYFAGTINLNSLKSKNNAINLEIKVVLENSQSPSLGLLEINKYNIFEYLKIEKTSDKCLQIIQNIEVYINQSKPVLFILHDVFPAGAQLFLINLLEWITKTYPEMNLEVLVNLQENQIANYGGGLGKNVFDRLEKICPVYFLNEKTTLPKNIDYIQHNHYSLIYVNTSVLGDLLESIGQINTPVIVHVHELEFWIKYRLGIEKFHKYFKYNPKFIACSNVVRNNLVNNLDVKPEQIEVIHAYVPIEKLRQNITTTRAEIREELNLSEDTFVISSCGTLDWRKGADLLVSLVVLLKEKLPSQKFVYLWIGSFPDELAESEMDFTIKKAGLEQDIVLLGHKTDPMNYLNASDVFVLLSKEDPFPLVMSESAICKLPTVGFDGSGGVSEFVESDAGLLAPYLNLEVMAQKIAILYNDPQLRKEMGENAFRKINELYNETVLAPKIVQLIQSLIQESSATSVGV